MAEKMKPSGIDWIGDIPNNWETSRIKYHYQISLGKMLQPIQENSTDTLEHYMCSANITWAGVDTSILKQMWFSPAEKKQYRLLDGDLLVSEGGDVAVSCIWRNELDECYLQNAVHRVRQNALSDNRFIYYWLFFLKNYGIVDLICNKATIAHFTKEKFGELPICIMSIDEQVAIADFLDKECAQIDSIAADLEKQIALLQQYKKSMITETVTKGLDKSVPMKDSGVEWTSKIPCHWEIKRFKYLCEYITDGSHFSPETTDEGYPYITAADVKGVGLDYDAAKKISQQDFISLRKAGCQPRKGDVLLVKDGATTGRIGMVTSEKPCVVLSSVAILRAPDNMDARYLHYLMESDFVQAQIQASMAGSAMPRTVLSKIINYWGITCPKEEQKEICDFLDRKCGYIETVIETKQVQQSTIQQHKKSLIYEYVTGKKRVKEVQ